MPRKPPMNNRPPMRVQVRLPGAPQSPVDRRRLLVIGGIWLLSLVLAVLGGCWMATPRDAQGQRLQAAEKHAETLQAQLTELRQKQATLEASDRISRAANTEVQSSLAERDEEIAGLRADVAFYERLVGSTSQRKGLNTHSIEFSPEAAGTWQYTAVLTQNLNRGAISQGQMRFTVEGVKNGKLATISWDDLHQRSKVPGQDYSCRYFQQTTGSGMRPADFTPQRVRVTLGSGTGGTTQMFGNSKSNRDGQLVVDALIGNQVVIRGDVEFSGGLYVEGRIHGKVIAAEGASGATLTVAEHGVIEGEIRAQVVVISGRLDGDVHATEKVELTPSARVNGNVHYQVVEMNAGAQLNGRLIHASAPMAALPAPEVDDADAGKGDTAARRKLAEAMA
ncbi:hypothetical protein G6F57_009975 [Rhizopus arrhizus]|nr:hypothetical protein G6F57_009975 [Rhizopus arrhizus]